MSFPKFSLSEVHDQLDTGNKWSNATITFAFAATSSAIGTWGGEADGFAPLSDVQKAAAVVALATWDDLIVNDFQQTSSARSDIEFATTTTGIGYAHAYYPSYGSVWLNSAAYESLRNPDIGEYGFSALVHEIGHAMGLNHMGDYNGTASKPSSYQDSTVYTVMSYYGPDHFLGAGDVAWGDWTDKNGVVHSPQTPMLYDIMVMQSIYGAETTTRVGNTVYGFDSSVEGSLSSIYDFTKNGAPILCLFDSGGKDTVDLSGYSTNSVLRLGAGEFSSFNYMTNNFSVAYTAVIENAVGGSGNDKLFGNAAANILKGGAGNDVLQGFDGNDKLMGGAGLDTLTGGAGKDQFVFDKSVVGSTASACDTVADFVRGSDLLSFVSAYDGVFAFITTQQFHGVEGELRFQRINNVGTDNDYTVVSGDVTGDGAADFAVKLAGLVKLASTDFLL